jgi:hypothetical protein
MSSTSPLEASNNGSIILSCPGVKSRYIVFTNADSDSDYIYINWEQYLGTNPPSTPYPVVYDRRLKNHWGFGINIGTFDAQGFHVFWDYRANWLRKFAADHPDYKIVLPE